MDSVSLEGLEFFAYHGFFDEEQVIGNKYTINLTVKANLSEASLNDQLQETINYGDLYNIIKEEMLIRSRLLENVAYRIIKRIFAEESLVEEIAISVSKFNPPIGGVCLKSSVTLERNRANFQK